MSGCLLLENDQHRKQKRLQALSHFPFLLFSFLLADFFHTCANRQVTFMVENIPIL